MEGGGARPLGGLEHQAGAASGTLGRTDRGSSRRRRPNVVLPPTSQYGQYRRMGKRRFAFFGCPGPATGRSGEGRHFLAAARSPWSGGIVEAEPAVSCLSDVAFGLELCGESLDGGADTGAGVLPAEEAGRVFGELVGVKCVGVAE
jgi:hypothetical protein